MRILGFDIRREDRGIVVKQDALAQMALDGGGSIRIPQQGTAYGAGFGDAITDRDREWAITREPVAYRVTYMVADDVLDKWFTIDDKATEGGDPKLDEGIQHSLDKLEAKRYLTDALALERTYGWSLIVGAFSDAAKYDDLAKPLKMGAELVSIASYGKNKVTSTEPDRDPDSERYGLPVIYYIDRGSGKRLKVHYSRVIRVQTRSTAASVLDPIWDDLTNLRNIRWGMGQTMFRYGGGFPVITLNGKTLEQIQAYLDAGYFTNLMARTYLVKNEQTEIDFKGMSGASLNPIPYYNPILENISAGTGIPEAVIRGAQAGALTGSEVNERGYFKLISSIQSKITPIVRQLVDWLIGEETEYDVNWLSGFEPSEKDKAATELMHQQAREVETVYKTIDEVRELEGLDPLPDGLGEKLKGIGQPATQPLPTESTLDPTKQAPGFETGDQAAHPVMVESLKEIARRVNNGSLTKSNALEQGRRLIELYVKQEVERAKAYLSQKLRRPVSILPPEFDRQYDEMLRGYFGDFEAIIEDAERAKQ